MIRRNFLKTLAGALVAPFLPPPPSPLEQSITAGAIGTGKTYANALDFEQLILEMVAEQSAKDLENLILNGVRMNLEPLPETLLPTHKGDEQFLWWRIKTKPAHISAYDIVWELQDIIHPKRAYGLLWKWLNRGLWDFGTNIAFGWLTPEGEKTGAETMLVLEFAALHSKEVYPADV